MSTVFCTSCGKEMPAKASFCPKCGSKVEPRAEEPPLPEEVLQEATPAAEGAEVATKPSRSKKLAAIIAVLLAVIVVDIVVIVATHGASQASPERTPGQMPNVPAVMAAGPGWTEEKFDQMMHLGEAGDGYCEFTIEDPVRGISTCTLFSTLGSGKFSGLSLYLMEIEEPSALSGGHAQDELRIKAGKNLVLYSPDGTRELASSAKNAKAFEQAVYDYSFPNREMLEFGRTDAEGLLARMGIEDYEVVGEYYGEKSLVAAIEEFSKTDGEGSVVAGTAYVMQAKTKDAKGKDYYVDLRADNSLIIQRCDSVSDELDVEQSQGVTVMVWDSVNDLGECTEYGYTEVSEPGEIVKVTKDYPESFSSVGSTASAGSGSQTGGSSSAKKSSDYILPDSDTRTYSRSELDKLSTHDLFLARNEIYARHGRGFQNQELKSYFGSKSWYRETVSSSNFNDNVLNSVERANATAMLEIEKERNSPYLN